MKTRINMPIHPKGLYLLFFTEMWERFSYYGMRALLTIYLVTDISKGGLGWSAKHAGQLYGIYTGLVYVTPLLGGWLAEKYMGYQKAVLIGAIIMALGHGSLALQTDIFFYLGICLLIVGNGFFKPNISSMVGQLYPETSPLKDAAYTIFYMGINIGAFMGTLLCGYLGENIGWHYGFGAAGIFMTIGLITFYFGKSLLGTLGLKPTQLSVRTDEETNETWTKVEKDRVMVIGFLSFFSIVFWMAFEQAGSSMSLFALNFTDRYIPWLDYTIPASWFQSLNPLFVIALAPILSMFWANLDAKNSPISSPVKFSIALFLLATGFGILVWGSWSIPPDASHASVSMFFIAAAIFLHTLGELCLSPVGLSSVSKLSPKKSIGVMFGVWFFASAIGNYISGALGGLIEEISKKQSMAVFFGITMSITFFASASILFLTKFLNKKMHGIP